MKPSGKKLVGLWCAETLLMSAAMGLWAEAKSNPFQTIVGRNAFALMDPVRQPTLQPSLPEKPSAVVKLRGLISVLPQKKALFEVAEAPGKSFQKLIMAEGERHDDIEVLSIDMGKNAVTIKNGSVVTNVTFEVSQSAVTPVGNPFPPSLPRLPH